MGATVKVTSSIEDNFEPNIINVSVWIEGKAESKEKAASAYNEAFSNVLNALEKAGVSKENVKTRYFRISPVWKKRRQTELYEYWSSLGFEEPCAEERFDAIWAALVSLGSGISSDFDYDLKDYEGAREHILRRAVDAGRKRAELLSDAAGCNLGAVVHIENGLRGGTDYGLDFAVATSGGSASLGESPVFNHETVSVECEVTLEYELVARA